MLQGCPEDGKIRSENEQNALYTRMKFSKKNNLKCIPMTILRCRRHGQNILHEYSFSYITSLKTTFPNH